MNGRRLAALTALLVGLSLQAQDVLITHAHVLTMAQGELPDGSVLVRNGRIAAVGKNLTAPPGVEVVDAKGQYLMPGIIDCHSHIGIEGGVNELSLSVTSMVGIEDVIDPEDINLYRALAGGVTSANLLHGSGNAIGGLNTVIKLRWGQDAKGLIFEGAPKGIKFALGENPKRTNALSIPGKAPRYPITRMGVMDVIRQAFVDARSYKAEWEAYRLRAQKEREALPPRRDLKLEPLVEILEGKRFVHAHCYRADEILQLLRLAEEFGFKIRTLQHVLEGYKVAPEIAKHGAGASTFSDWWAYKMEAYDAIPHNAALLVRAGVLTSINSDSQEEGRHLNQEAAKTLRYGGLTEHEALRLITLNPAQQLGIDKQVGSIEAGKDADLALFNVHPLSVYAVPQKVWVDGRLKFDRAKDLAGRDAVAKDRAALMARQKARPQAPATPPGVPPSGAEFDDVKGRFGGDHVCLHDGHQEGE